MNDELSQRGDLLLIARLQQLKNLLCDASHLRQETLKFAREGNPPCNFSSPAVLARLPYGKPLTRLCVRQFIHPNYCHPDYLHNLEED